MRAIVGLGNPGPEYRGTRHNIGFDVVAAFAKDHKIKINKSLHFSVYGKGKIAGEDVLLVLPQTYMNLSGRAVGEISGSLVHDKKDIIVVCDDINIELGRIRIRPQGSSGGQKGLESIITTLRSDEIPRLRVGIATEVHKGDITNYVLSPFKRKEARNVDHVIALAADAITFIIEHGIDDAMAKFNKRKVGTS